VAARSPSSSRSKKEPNGLGQAPPAIFNRRALPVGSGNFGTVTDVPVAISFKDCREFVFRDFLLAKLFYPPRNSPRLSPMAAIWVATIDHTRHYRQKGYVEASILTLTHAQQTLLTLTFRDL
jgi:hypothetical protein